MPDLGRGPEALARGRSSLCSWEAAIRVFVPIARDLLAPLTQALHWGADGARCVPYRDLCWDRRPRLGRWFPLPGRFISLVALPRSPSSSRLRASSARTSAAGGTKRESAAFTIVA
jgi:hypothetical protein